MKKILLCLLSFASVYAEDNSNTIKKQDGYFYLSAMTSNNNLIKNLLYPYYVGMGYRFKIGKNAIDLNINVPVLIVKYKDYNIFNSDLSYIRYFDNNYYFVGGLTQEGGRSSSLDYYMISPFVGFGREYILKNSKIFTHFKLNSLSYFPYLSPRWGYYIREEVHKSTFWKFAQFNICAGFNF